MSSWSFSAKGLLVSGGGGYGRDSLCGFWGQVEHEKSSMPGLPGRNTVKQERAQFHSGVSETYLNLDSKVVHCVPLDKSLNFSEL